MTKLIPFPVFKTSFPWIFLRIAPPTAAADGILANGDKIKY